MIPDYNAMFVHERLMRASSLTKLRKEGDLERIK
jgi:hypothetical protein